MVTFTLSLRNYKGNPFKIFVRHAVRHAVRHTVRHAVRHALKCAINFCRVVPRTSLSTINFGRVVHSVPLLSTITLVESYTPYLHYRRLTLVESYTPYLRYRRLTFVESYLVPRYRRLTFVQSYLVPRYQRARKEEVDSGDQRKF